MFECHRTSVFEIILILAFVYIGIPRLHNRCFIKLFI
jgi:hypothetical protein